MKLPVSIYQIAIAIVSITFIINRLIRVIKREQTQSLFKVSTVIIIWSTILILALYPSIASFVARKLGIEESINSLIFIGFIVIFILIFKLLSIIEKTERDITEIIRKEALKDLSNKRL